MTVVVPSAIPTGTRMQSEPPLKLDSVIAEPPCARSPEDRCAAPTLTSIVVGSRRSAPLADRVRVPVLRNMARAAPVIDWPWMVTESCADTMSASVKLPPIIVNWESTCGRIVSRWSRTEPPIAIVPVGDAVTLTLRP